jgi:hypothetical protein
MTVSTTSSWTAYAKRPGKSDYPLAAMGVVAQTPCDVVANLYLRCRLAEVDGAAVIQFKAHHVLHHAMSPSLCHSEKVRRLEAILEVAEEGQRRAIRRLVHGKICCSNHPRFRTIQACPKDMAALPRQPEPA